jgi:hypothetical protein
MVFFIIFVEINNIMETEKETLEKAAANYGWRIKKNTFSDAVKANELAESAQQDFIAGAKWQAERMYSEEDLRRAYTVGKHGGVNQTYYDFDEWFKQNKKK